LGAGLRAWAFTVCLLSDCLGTRVCDSKQPACFCHFV
jgi:hypothetical protein